MAGMIIGVTVVKGPAAAPAAAASRERPLPRRLTLDMAGTGEDREPRFGFTLSGDGVTRTPTTRVSSPGPAIVLRRDEPVEITVDQSSGREHRAALARHGAGQHLRRRARMERHRHECWPR